MEKVSWTEITLSSLNQINDRKNIIPLIRCGLEEWRKSAGQKEH